MNIDTIPILKGSHPTFADGACALEMVAYLAGEPHSDHPACACPVISSFVRRWNDGIRNDEERTRVLRPLLPLLVGSRKPASEERRMWLAVDWAIRDSAPAWLDRAGLSEHATRLRTLAPVDRDTLAATRKMINKARSAAVAAVADADAFRTARQVSATDLVRRMVAA